MRTITTDASRHRKSTFSAILKFSAIICATLLAPFFLIYLFSAPPGISLAWDWANAAGYMACVLTLLLFVYAGKPRAFPPFSGRFFANLHRDLGYIAFLLTISHVGVLLISEPLLLDHLKLTAPLYMLAGLLAAVLMLLLVIPSIPRLRKAMWPDYHRFKAIHGYGAIIMLFLLGYHVALSQFYLNTLLKQALMLACALAVACYYLLRKYRHANVNNIGRIKDSAKYAAPISFGCTALLVVASVIFAWVINIE